MRLSLMPSLRYSELTSARSLVNGRTAMESMTWVRGWNARNPMADAMSSATMAPATANSLRGEDCAAGDVAVKLGKTMPLSLEACGELVSRLRRWRSARISEALW